MKIIKGIFVVCILLFIVGCEAKQISVVCEPQEQTGIRKVLDCVECKSDEVCREISYYSGLGGERSKSMYCITSQNPLYEEEEEESQQESETTYYR